MGLGLIAVSILPFATVYMGPSSRLWKPFSIATVLIIVGLVVFFTAAVLYAVSHNN